VIPARGRIQSTNSSISRIFLDRREDGAHQPSRSAASTAAFIRATVCSTLAARSLIAAR
jgi:hypothetical protein